MRDNFERIIGYEDVKKELRTISDMLNHPEVYKDAARLATFVTLLRRIMAENPTLTLISVLS